MRRRLKGGGEEAGAAGKSLPERGAPGLSGINPTQRFANSGNPDLKAYQSNNYDLGLEWYFGRGNAIYASVFRKDIDNFIGTVTHLNVDAFGVNFRTVWLPSSVQYTLPSGPIVMPWVR